jgi:hypothetical protein
MHAVTEFCCLSQQITLNQDCMPGHAWICMRITDACMQRLASRQAVPTAALRHPPAPPWAAVRAGQPPKGPIRAIKVKKWP